MIQPQQNPLLKPKPVQTSFDCADIKVPTIYKSKLNKTELKKLFRKETARDAIGELYKNMSIFGFTKGQFSIIDVLEHCLNQCPDASVSISTWTAAKNDLNVAHELIKKGLIKDIRFLIDFSFLRRAPALLQEIRNNFGHDSIRVTRNHAKFALIKNEDFNLVIKTSMNLNFNPRLENFSIEDDENLYNFFDVILNDIFKKPSSSNNNSKSIYHDKHFKQL